MTTQPHPFIIYHQFTLKSRIVNYLQDLYHVKRKNFIEWFQLIDPSQKVQRLLQTYKNHKKHLFGSLVLIVIIVSSLLNYLDPLETTVAKSIKNQTTSALVNTQLKKTRVTTLGSMIQIQQQRNQSFQLHQPSKDQLGLVSIEKMQLNDNLSQNKSFLMRELVKTETKLAAFIQQIQPEIISFNSVAIYQAKLNLKCQLQYGKEQPQMCKIYEESRYIKQIPYAPKSCPLDKESIRLRKLHTELYKIRLFPYIQEQLTSPKKYTWFEKIKISILQSFNIYKEWSDLFLMVEGRSRQIHGGIWQATGGKLTVGSYLIDNTVYPPSYNVRLFVPTMFYFQFPNDTPQNHTIEIYGIRLGYNSATGTLAPVYKNKLGSFNVHITLNEENTKTSAKRIVFCESMECNYFYSLITIQSNNPLALHGLRIYTSLPID